MYLRREMIETAITASAGGVKPTGLDQSQLTDLLIAKQEELKQGLKMASEQSVVEDKIAVVQAQVDKQHDEIRLLQTRLKDAEHVLVSFLNHFLASNEKNRIIRSTSVKKPAYFLFVL
jgi:hypothetical protein